MTHAFGSTHKFKAILFINLLTLGITTFAENNCDSDLLPFWGEGKQVVSSKDFMDQMEKYLGKIGSLLEANDSRLKLKVLEAGNTTKTSWMVKLACNDRIVANLKCTFGNTYAQAEVAKYKLGKAVGFNIFPVSIPARVNHSDIVKTDCTLKMWAEAFNQIYYCVRDNCKSVCAPTPVI